MDSNYIKKIKRWEFNSAPSFPGGSGDVTIADENARIYIRNMTIFPNSYIQDF
jgi:hypothetical protein